MRARIPDPQAEATFASAKLDWNDLAKPHHAEWLGWYRRVLEARRKTIVGLIPQISGSARYELLGDGAVFLQWTLREGGTLNLAANLSATLIEGFPAASGSVVWQEGEVRSDGVFGAWTIRWSVEAGLHKAGH